MKKTFTTRTVNYILLQLVGLTFVCIMLFIDLFIEKDLTYLRYGLQSFTLVAFIIFEVIVHIVRSRANIKLKENKSLEEETNVKVKPHNEKYLWFEMLLLLDIILINAIITTVSDNVNITILLIASLVLYYIISVIIRPYFGIMPKDKKE